MIVISLLVSEYKSDIIKVIGLNIKKLFSKIFNIYES